MITIGQLARGIFHLSRGIERLLQKELSKELSQRRGNGSRKMENFEIMGLEDYL